MLGPVKFEGTGMENGAFPYTVSFLLHSMRSKQANLTVSEHRNERTIVQQADFPKNEASTGNFTKNCPIAR